MNLEGRLLGNRYEIIKKIGNGGMATVYKARCHVLNRYVAVKVLKDEFTTDEEFIKRFNTEAQAVACFSHPNIVSVYDVGTEGNLHYIVMELIQGKTLKEIIKEDGALSWKWSVNVAIQIASALEIAHKNNIVHRDIKPHNIIITEDGIAKVTDFGIAKSVSNSTITAFGTTIGSVHYFSPEHARGGYTDAKSDLYSLGVVLYEMVTGKVPFDADTPVSVALKHMQEEAVEPRKINRTVPLAVNNIIMKAMKKDVNQRYQTATAMLKDLSLALKTPNEPIVVLDNEENDYPTQKVSIMNDDMLEARRNRTAKMNAEEKRNSKSGNKFFALIKRHKIISGVLGLILLFVISLTATEKIVGATKVKDVQIPKMVGLKQEEAKQLAESQGFVYEVGEEKYDAEVEEGVVISQDPEYKANFSIKEKSKITVVVSLGQQITKVPKVKGMEKDKAIEELENNLLEYEIEEEYDEKVEAGIVLEQDQKANEEVPAGTVVKLKVSLGIEKVQIPNVANPKLKMTESEAKKELEKLGLKVKVEYKEDTTKDDGIVLSQNKDAGTEVEKGSEITIVVNSLPEKKDGKITIDIEGVLGKKAYKTVEETTKDENGEDVTTEKEVARDDINVEIFVDDSSVYSATANGDDIVSYTVENRTGNVDVKIKVDGTVVYNDEFRYDDTTLKVNN